MDHFRTIHRRDRKAVLTVTERDRVSRADERPLIRIDFHMRGGVTKSRKWPLWEERDRLRDRSPENLSRAVTRGIALAGSGAMMTSGGRR